MGYYKYLILYSIILCLSVFLYTADKRLGVANLGANGKDTSSQGNNDGDFHAKFILMSYSFF